jgi:hypothetical protein
MLSFAQAAKRGAAGVSRAGASRGESCAFMANCVGWEWRGLGMMRVEEVVEECAWRTRLSIDGHVPTLLLAARADGAATIAPSVALLHTIP